MVVSALALALALALVHCGGGVVVLILVSADTLIPQEKEENRTKNHSHQDGISNGWACHWFGPRL